MGQSPDPNGEYRPSVQPEGNYCMSPPAPDSYRNSHPTQSCTMYSPESSWAIWDEALKNRPRDTYGGPSGPPCPGYPPRSNSTEFGSYRRPPPSVTYFGGYPPPEAPPGSVPVQRLSDIDYSTYRGEDRRLGMRRFVDSVSPPARHERYGAPNMEIRKRDHRRYDLRGLKAKCERDYRAAVVPTPATPLRPLYSGDPRYRDCDIPLPIGVSPTHMPARGASKHDDDCSNDRPRDDDQKRFGRERDFRRDFEGGDMERKSDREPREDKREREGDRRRERERRWARDFGGPPRDKPFKRSNVPDERKDSLVAVHPRDGSVSAEVILVSACS